MSLPKDKIRKEIEELIATKYTLPPQQFAEEESAVKKTVEQLVIELSQPAKQKSLLPAISMDSIENMTRRGCLTLIAPKLDDHFLIAIEEIIKKANLKFFHDGDSIALLDLYEKCKKELTVNDKEPHFEDVLLRMYSIDSPFYKKLNAIVSGYNNPKTTTDTERKAAFLFNIAIHKAGLMKRMFEVQNTPTVLYRGQSFGLQNFVKKFIRVKELYAKGQLASLTPEQLVEINIVDIVAKKNVSMSSVLTRAVSFANGEGVVLHIRNPEQLADFYAVANISAFPAEAEFLSRVPDDVAMIPIDIVVDPTDKVTHIHVMCIHSQNTQLHNSTRLNDLKDTLKNYLEKEIKRSYGFFTSYTKKQKALLEQLNNLVVESDKNLLIDPAKQAKFLETSIQLLIELYNCSPSESKKGIKAINALLQNYSAIVGDFSVTHKLSNASEVMAREQKILDKNLQGKRRWLSEMTFELDKKRLQPLKKDLDDLLRPDASLSEIRQAAVNIVDLLKVNPTIGDYFKLLDESIKSIIKSLDKIEEQQQILTKSTVNTGKQEQNFN